MSAQTPGPWLVTQGAVFAGNVHICCAPPHRGKWMPTDSEVETSQANFRLIAAAPELLEACQLIVSAFDALAPVSAARSEPLQINAARAAIAKATEVTK